ncbi:15656_t:CDS:2, partial [Acaulospora morrowiae]
LAGSSFLLSIAAPTVGHYLLQKQSGSERRFYRFVMANMPCLFLILDRLMGFHIARVGRLHKWLWRKRELKISKESPNADSVEVPTSPTNVLPYEATDLIDSPRL